MFSFEFVERLREWEIARLLPHFPPAARVLEIGGGTGHQAQRLSEAGHSVTAIDLPSSLYADKQVFPVHPYDGRTFPVADRSVDVVFSSNVLEHVLDLPRLHEETRRVLRPGGLCIHLMPTAVWRWWTIVTHYPDVMVWCFKTLADVRPGAKERLSVGRSLARVARILALNCLPRRHGERGTAWSELWTFSRRRWLGHFVRQGYEIISAEPMGLFYTGNMLFGRRISLETRENLADRLGSALVFYKVRPLATAGGGEP